MKAFHKIVAGLAVAGLAVSVAVAARPMPRKLSQTAIDGGTAATAAAAAGIVYSTGFEAAEGFTTLGFISHAPGFFPAGCLGTPASPCWGHTTAAGFSLITPTIEGGGGANPFAGTQHLRLTFDTTTRTNVTGFGLGVDARYPRSADVDAHPDAPNTVSVMIAIDTPNGQDFVVQPQSNSMGSSQTIALFFYAGTIYIVDDTCHTSTNDFVAAGFWDTTGGYQNYLVEQDPCNDHVVHSYAGSVILDTCIWNGTRLDQFLVFGDNYPGSTIDVDDLVMLGADGPCPSVCGNGVIEPPVEVCDPAAAQTGCAAGHACGAVGTPEQCTCDRICTLAAPCNLVNGSNGPFLGPFDATYGGIFIYNAPTGVDAVSVELCGSTGADQNIFYWGSCTDPADPGSANDDCYPGYSGADPSASCYGTVTGPNYESCTCHDNPLDGDNCYLLQIRGGNAESALIEINKKSVCAGGHLGACCDTNGADTGCTDNVLSGDCAGADKVWTENGKCATVTCTCIPDCTGATCGDNGCGGSCGTCDDGNVCNGLETCNAGRTCDAGTPLNCDDGLACTNDVCDSVLGCGHGAVNCDDANACTNDSCVEPGGCAHAPRVCDNGQFCDGVETCNPSSGCVPGTAPNCDDGVDCTVDSCDEVLDACAHDDADCSIPTVSEWGLVVLALMLLIGAKVYFGRRQAIA